jgi:hypothetical protein
MISFRDFEIEMGFLLEKKKKINDAKKSTCKRLANVEVNFYTNIILGTIITIICSLKFSNGVKIMISSVSIKMLNEALLYKM